MGVKQICVILCIMVLLGGFTWAATENYEELIQNRVAILVDETELDTYDEEQKMDLPAFIYQNRTLLPLRKTFSIFDVEPKWNPDNRTIEAEYNGNTIWLQVDNPKIKINNIETTIDVPAKIFQNRTYVPIRKIFEALDMEIQWDDQNRRVLINKNKELFLENFDLRIQHGKALDLTEAVQIDENTIEINSISDPSQKIIIVEYNTDMDTTLISLKEERPAMEYTQLRFTKNERIYYSELEEDFRGNIQRFFLTEKNNKTFFWYFNNFSYDESFKLVNSID